MAAEVGTWLLKIAYPLSVCLNLLGSQHFPSRSNDWVNDPTFLVFLVEAQHAP